MTKAEFEFSEETPYFYIDGVTGHVEPGAAEIMIFKTDSEPEFDDNGKKVEWENAKHDIQAVLKMSPLTLQRMTVFLNKLLDNFQERMKKMEGEKEPEKMFG